MSQHAIACGHAQTARAASDVLQAGGNAVDATIAAALMAMVAEPVLAGLLGGGFLMVRPPDGTPHLLDFFVQTPGRKVPATDQDFREILAEFESGTQPFHIGAATIAVPGAAPGLAEAHARFGHMPFRELAGAACVAARTGIELTDFQSRLSAIVAEILRASLQASDIFLPDGNVPAPGTKIANPALADVLEVYAAEGPRFVTEGEIASALMTLTEQGGHLTAGDLTAYAPEWRKPLMRTRADARIAMNPPPSLGGTLIALSLNLLPSNPDAADYALAFEATSSARIDAALDADPIGGARRLGDPALVDRYRRDIAKRRQSIRGTTHISVIDSQGMGAAMTLSNGEGCGLIAPGTGIMPNNMLGETDLLPDGHDSWTPGQRLSSMMAPMAVDWPDGSTMLLGSGGSNRIRTALAQVLCAVTDDGVDLADAIAAQRLHVEPAEANEQPIVDFEDLGNEQFREAVLAAFPEARAWPQQSMFFGGVHAALRRSDGSMDAAGDPRRAGVSSLG